MLVLRYRTDFYKQFTDFHLIPFTIIFAIWIVLFYIAGLYDLRRLRNSLDFFKMLNLTIILAVALAVFLFYLVPAFGIAPKTNLFLFLTIFVFLEVFWRRIFNKMAARGEAPNKVLLIEGNGGTETIDSIIAENPHWLPQLGYEIAARVQGETIIANPQRLQEITSEKNINLVVVPRRLKGNPRLTRILYELLNAGVEIHDLPNFYELIARKIPLADLEETWFLENIAGQQKFYDPLKHGLEVSAAAILGILLLPLELLMALLIRATSKGPAIYKQIRVGKNGHEFALYKFRTMAVDAERGGAKWASPGDKRATPFGKFLRHTHLDELPQLLNIMKGDLSFVGPRPERPEFVKVLKEKIPYYEIRLLIKPGVTGWAQVHHRKDASTEDVVQKLQYDIYYLKNRSPILDLAIILKTIKTLFVTPK